MKKNYLISICIILLLFNRCHSPSLNQSVEKYKSYFNDHKDDLNSIVKYVITNYTDSNFNKIGISRLKELLKKTLQNRAGNDVINDLLQIDYYKYGDSIKTVRIFVDQPHNTCVSLSFFKELRNDRLVCETKNDSLYMGDCWSLFLIKQSPCYDPFEK